MAVTLSLLTLDAVPHLLSVQGNLSTGSGNTVNYSYKHELTFDNGATYQTWWAPNYTFARTVPYHGVPEGSTLGVRSTAIDPVSGPLTPATAIVKTPNAKSQRRVQIVNLAGDTRIPYTVQPADIGSGIGIGKATITGLPAWEANADYLSGVKSYAGTGPQTAVWGGPTSDVILDTHGNYQMCTNPGWSGFVQPTWSTVVGSVTTEPSGLQWTNVGAGVTNWTMTEGNFNKGVPNTTFSIDTGGTIKILTAPLPSQIGVHQYMLTAQLGTSGQIQQGIKLFFGSQAAPVPNCQFLSGPLGQSNSYVPYATSATLNLPLGMNGNIVAAFSMAGINGDGLNANDGSTGGAINGTSQTFFTTEVLVDPTGAFNVELAQLASAKGTFINLFQTAFLPTGTYHIVVGHYGLPITPPVWAANAAKVAGAVIKDSNNNIQQVTGKVVGGAAQQVLLGLAAGTTNTTVPSAWARTPGSQTFDNTLVWTCRGPLSAPTSGGWAAPSQMALTVNILPPTGTINVQVSGGVLIDTTTPPGTSIASGSVGALPSWAATTSHAVTDQIRDSNGNMQMVIAVAGAGKTGSTAPTWGNIYGASTPDGSITWQCKGTANAGSFTPTQWTIIPESYAPAGFQRRVIDSRGVLSLSASGYQMQGTGGPTNASLSAGMDCFFLLATDGTHAAVVEVASWTDWVQAKAGVVLYTVNSPVPVPGATNFLSLDQLYAHLLPEQTALNKSGTRMPSAGCDVLIYGSNYYADPSSGTPVGKWFPVPCRMLGVVANGQWPILSPYAPGCGANLDNGALDGAYDMVWDGLAIIGYKNNPNNVDSGDTPNCAGFCFKFLNSGRCNVNRCFLMLNDVGGLEGAKWRQIFLTNSYFARGGAGNNASGPPLHNWYADCVDLHVIVDSSFVCPCVGTGFKGRGNHWLVDGVTVGQGNESNSAYSYDGNIGAYFVAGDLWIQAGPNFVTNHSFPFGEECMAHACVNPGGRLRIKYLHMACDAWISGPGQPQTGTYSLFWNQAWDTRAYQPPSWLIDKADVWLPTGTHTNVFSNDFQHAAPNSDIRIASFNTTTSGNLTQISRVGMFNLNPPPVLAAIGSLPPELPFYQSYQDRNWNLDTNFGLVPSCPVPNTYTSTYFQPNNAVGVKSQLSWGDEVVIPPGYTGNIGKFVLLPSVVPVALQNLPTAPNQQMKNWALEGGGGAAYTYSPTPITVTNFLTSQGAGVPVHYAAGTTTNNWDTIIAASTTITPNPLFNRPIMLSKLLANAPTATGNNSNAHYPVNLNVSVSPVWSKNTTLIDASWISVDAAGNATVTAPQTPGTVGWIVPQAYFWNTPTAPPAWQASHVYPIGSRISDSNGNVQVAQIQNTGQDPSVWIASGTSDTTQPATWGTKITSVTADSATLSWICAGGVGAAGPNSGIFKRKYYFFIVGPSTGPATPVMVSLNAAMDFVIGVVKKESVQAESLSTSLRSLAGLTKTLADSFGHIVGRTRPQIDVPATTSVGNGFSWRGGPYSAQAWSRLTTFHATTTSGFAMQFGAAMDAFGGLVLAEAPEVDFTTSQTLTSQEVSDSISKLLRRGQANLDLVSLGRASLTSQTQPWGMGPYSRLTSNVITPVFSLAMVANLAGDALAGKAEASHELADILSKASIAAASGNALIDTKSLYASPAVGRVLADTLGGLTQASIGLAETLAGQVGAAPQGGLETLQALAKASLLYAEILGKQAVKTEGQGESRLGLAGRTRAHADVTSTEAAVATQESLEMDAKAQLAAAGAALADARAISQTARTSMASMESITSQEGSVGDGGYEALVAVASQPGLPSEALAGQEQDQVGTMESYSQLAQALAGFTDALGNAAASNAPTVTYEVLQAAGVLAGTAAEWQATTLASALLGAAEVIGGANSTIGVATVRAEIVTNLTKAASTLLDWVRGVKPIVIPPLQRRWRIIPTRNRPPRRPPR